MEERASGRPAELPIIAGAAFGTGPIFVAALAIRLFFYTGIIASDDLGYSHFTQQIASLRDSLRSDCPVGAAVPLLRSAQRRL